MNLFQFVTTTLVITSIVYGKSVIDNGTRFIELSNQFIDGDTETNSIESIPDEDCPILTPELISEIQSHQPLVDKLTKAVVNGEFSGDTWNA